MTSRGFPLLQAPNRWARTAAAKSMSFWKSLTISWILAWWVALGGGSPGAEEAFAPWMFHPLRGGTRLQMRNCRWTIDYTREPRPHWVHLEFSAELEHRGSQPLTEQFLVVSPDEGLKVSWEGRSIAQDRLVAELPKNAYSRLKGLSRVAVFQLILLGNEKGRLNISGYHRVEFISTSCHRWQLLPPVMKAWGSLGGGRLELNLSPELKLLSDGWSGAGTAYHRLWNPREGLPLEIRAEAPLGAGNWTVLRVPPLRRALFWAVGAVALAVLASSLAPRFALLFWALTCLGLWLAPRWDLALGRWNHYADARLYEQWLGVFLRGVAPVLAGVACWLGTLGKKSGGRPRQGEERW